MFICPIGIFEVGDHYNSNRYKRFSARVRTTIAKRRNSILDSIPAEIKDPAKLESWVSSFICSLKLIMVVRDDGSGGGHHFTISIMFDEERVWHESFASASHKWSANAKQLAFREAYDRFRRMRAGTASYDETKFFHQLLDYGSGRLVL